jgi:adenylate cyclase class 2
MPAALEREVKLKFTDPATARAAVVASGATPLRSRRLQEDCLLDTYDGTLRKLRSALRVRVEAGHALVTFKGPVQSSSMKVREELETLVGDGDVLLHILRKLGFEIWFRYEKYREEFALEDAILAVDETPVGTFVEIEGSQDGIAAAAVALGRGPSDYLLDSYRSLFVQHCEIRGARVTDMLFETA